MAVFGDADPEDAYDASDPLPVRTLIVETLISSIDEERRADGPTVRVLARVAVLRRIIDDIATELEGP
jgi:hypothetical protein